MYLKYADPGAGANEINSLGAFLELARFSQ
jgi:hypothetical protein